MIPIPEELLEQVERGNVLLFIGERIVHDAGGQVALDRLTDQLAARCKLDAAESYTFPEVAQVYEEDKGRHALIQFIREYLEVAGDEPQPVHRLVAGLTQCGVLVTTALNRRLERAFDEARRPLDVFISNEDLPFEDESRAKLYKLRGSLERVESLILTEDDFDQFFDDQAGISVVLQGYLARKTILFIGYDLDDPNFKRLFLKVTAPLDDYARRAYAFGESPPPKVSRWCARHGISVVVANATAFLLALVDQLNARARPAAAARPQLATPDTPLPDHPYKLLDYYEAGDAAIFFGRQQETQALSALIHAHRLSLMYGASGVGKTSLLLAGAVPRLEYADPPYATIYARALEDPAQVIRQAVRRRLSDVTLPSNGPLVDFLDSATDALGRPLVIVLDQFEEFFIRLSSQFRAAFIADLGALYDARDVPVKVVLSLREDWLAAIGELEKRIPEVFRNRMRVLPLTREQARESIITPVEHLGVQYEPELVERLLDDLAGSTGADVMPPQLQLVCSALYGGLQPGERLISLAAYERLGGARGVLQQYLDDELARLGKDERVLARGALEDLVTSQGTKAVKTVAEVAFALDVASADLAPVLEKLVQARLLRAIEREDGGTAYELAHEYLIREIGLGAEAQARKQAEELIQQEVENWRRFGTLLAADKLALINDSRAVLRLGPDAQELLLRSELEVGDEVDYWLSRMDDPEQRARVLADKARTRVAAVRRRTAAVLGTQDVPESVEPLLELALRDADRSVCTAARASLVQLEGQRANVVGRLRAELGSGDRVARRAAREALAGLPLRDLPDRLRTLVLVTRAQMRAVWLGRLSVATPGRRAVAITATLLFIFGVLVFIFSANSYHIATRNSPVAGDPYPMIVVLRGYPTLNLPGLGEVLANTGISMSQVSEDGRANINDQQLWGLLMRNGDGNYRKWGQDLATALQPADRATMLWYLGRRDDALKLILVELRNGSDQQASSWSLSALKDVALATSDAITPQAVDVLIGLLKEAKEDYARNDLEVTLEEVAAANPAIVTPEVAEGLIDLFFRSNRYVDKQIALGQVGASTTLTDRLMSLGRIGTANSKVAPQIMVALASQISNHDDSYVAATTALDSVVDANPMIALQTISKLAAQLSDADPNVRAKAAAALEPLVARPALTQGLVVNSELATPRESAALLPGLADEDPAVRAAAAATLGHLLVAAPALAPQVVNPLVARLSDKDSVARAMAASELGHLLAANAALTPQLIDLVAKLHTDPDPEVRASVASAFLNVRTADPSVARQVFNTLVLLLADEQSGIGESAAFALKRVIQTNPKLSAQAIEVLMAQLHGTDVRTRSFAVGALRLVVDANPEVAPQVVAPLAALLADDHARVRISAANALEGVAYANPTAMTAPVAEALVQRLDDKEIGVRDSVMAAVEHVGRHNPTAATPPVIALLIKLRTDPDGSVRMRAIDALGYVGAANPGVAEKVLVELSRRGVKDDIFEDRLASSAIERVLAANPKLAISRGQLNQIEVTSPELARQAFALLEERISGRELNGKGSAIKLLGQIGAANPSVVTTQIITDLEQLLTDKDLRSYAVDALGKIGKTNAAVITPQVIEDIERLLADTESDRGFEPTTALAQIYAQQYLQLGLRADLFDKLTDPQNVLERPVAARALFLIVLTEPSREPVIRDRLRMLASSREPIARIWANKTLQMIDLIGRARKAINDPLQQDGIENLAPYYDYQHGFFGPDFTWAAQQALDWLNKQTKDKPRATP